MLAYVFPGQGSQVKGMGQGLFDEFPELVKKADAILGYSIKELCLEDPRDELGMTQFTQPALYVVCGLQYLKTVKETGKKPDFVAGHSLGEYTALFAAGVFDFETGLKLVQKRGALMGLAKNGGMAAVIGLREEEIREVMKNNHLDTIDLANLNSPKQSVLSGKVEDLAKYEDIFMQAGAAQYIKLKVSGAFHSRYMQPAKEEFEIFMEQFEFHEPQIPVISNLKARPYSHEAKQIRETLLLQMTNPVRWEESVCYIWGKGDVEFEQIGPGRVLPGLIKQIKRMSKPFIAEDAEETKDTPVIEHTVTETVKKEAVMEDRRFMAESLGNEQFKKDYGLKYAYAAGSMCRGISSITMVKKLAENGMLGFAGTKGLTYSQIEELVREAKSRINNKYTYGFGIFTTMEDEELEEKLVSLYLKNHISMVEASCYISITPALVQYRLTGLKRNSAGQAEPGNHIMAKLSRPEIAEKFMRPAPEKMVEKLLQENKITAEEALLAKEIPMSEDICVEADSAGKTDGSVVYAVLPTIQRYKDRMMKEYKYQKEIRVGAAGGIGTPEAVAASFLMKADFILTGSINQCTIEAGTSEAVKDMLSKVNIQDTFRTHAGDMFEYGSEVQVMKKGVLFHVRANQLYEIYQTSDSIEKIASDKLALIENKFFKKPAAEVYKEILSKSTEEEIRLMDAKPKVKMAKIFKYYFTLAFELALKGDRKDSVDYQVYCGPAMGAFNQWAAKTALEDWRNRSVSDIGVKLMEAGADVLQEMLR